MNQRICFMLVLLASLVWSTAATATIVSRGTGFVYDTALDITWQRDANQAGLLSYDGAVSWAASLGSGWHLPYASVSAGVGPTTSIVNCAFVSEVVCRDNQLGHLFTYDLGGVLGADKTGNQTALSGETFNGILFSYWTQTVYNDDFAWRYIAGAVNVQTAACRSPDCLLSGWAVHGGDVFGPHVSTVSEPSSHALFVVGIGLIGFIRFRFLRR